MNDNYEKNIKNKINNYMEQIKVPKNLGGIIMEDFEKIKNNEEQKQEVKQGGNVNKKPKGKKALKLSIAAASAIVLVGVGILVGTKLVGNSTITVNNDGAQNSNMVSGNNEEIKEEKQQISSEESSKLLEFLNNGANNPFTQIEYSNPESLFNNSNNRNTLIYAVFNDFDNKYCSTATREQLKIAYGSESEDIVEYPEYISEENLIKFLKEKTNHEYSVEILRGAFNYQKNLNGYFGKVMDSITMPVTIKDGYKIGDKYYLTLSQSTTNGNGNKLISDKQIDIVLSESDDTYYFYSCKITTTTSESSKTEISNEESAKLLKFFNNTVNNPFTQIKYGSPANLFSEIDTSDSCALRYAVFNIDNEYCSSLTTDQKSKLKTTKYGSSIDEVPWYFITEENLIKFLKEKMNYTYSKDILRQVFHYEETVNGYIDCISDTTYLEVSIYSGRKMGDTYSLTLRTAEKEIFMSILEKDGAYYFESCNY